MQLTATIDTSAFEALQQKMLGVIEHDSVEVVAETHKKIILGLTGQGADFSGEIFQPYSPQYAKKRAKEGYRTDVKDLRKTGGLLNSLELRGNSLTVDGDHQKIALGQITGASGKWAYSHDFLNVSEDTNEKAAEELADHIMRAL